MADSPWFDFAQVASNNLLRLNQQKAQEQQAIRDQANLIFQQERQKALESHYMDMAKHQAATELQAQINQKFKADKEEKDAQRKMYSTFTDEYNDLTEKGGKTPGEAFVKAMAKIGMKPGDQEAPPPIKDFMDSLWKDAQAKMPAMPTPGAGTATMPQVQPPQMMPGMPGGGVVGVPQNQPFQQGAQVPNQAIQPQMAPNVNMQPAEATAPPSAFPQDRQGWESTNIDPVFALAKAKVDAAVKAKNDAIAIQRDKAAIAKEDIYSKIEDRKVRQQIQSMNAYSNKQVREARSNFMDKMIGIRTFDNDTKRLLAEAKRDWMNADAASIGVKLQQGWARLSREDQDLFLKEGAAAETRFRDISGQIDNLVGKRNSLIEKRSELMNSRTFPEDPEAQNAIIGPLNEGIGQIDDALEGPLVPSTSGIGVMDRDKSLGLRTQQAEAKKMVELIPVKQETKPSGQPMPGSILKAMNKGSLPDISVGGFRYLDARPLNQRSPQTASELMDLLTKRKK